MTQFTELMAGAQLSEDWMQGRTTYGGLTAALCVEAARRGVSDLPPLRSAQFAFIGPAAGTLSTKVEVLRRGKSALFVSVDLSGEAGLATRATLSYGVARSSKIAYANLAMPKVARAGECEPFFFGDRPLVRFQEHFESRLAGGTRPMSGAAVPEYLIWFRHRDENARSGIVPLIALADAPPPSAMAMFLQAAPISTMTWSLDVLVDAPETDDGWWLVKSAAENAHAGYSAQAMTVWNAQGEAVIAARQTVAIFL